MRGVGRMKSPCTDSLVHTTWECKYHIVFAPKYRRKEVEIINAEACTDHIHMYVSIPTKDMYIIIYGIFKRKEQADNI